MKKWLIIVIAFVLCGGAVAGALLLFGGDFYDAMRERLARPASKIVLTTKVGEGVETLSGSYAVSFENGKAKVEYAFEKFALFELQDGEYVVPTERKQSVTGGAVVVNGEYVVSNGEAPTLAASILTLSGLSFKEEYFENALIADTSFEGDVKDVATLNGLPKDCKNVHLSLTFDEEYVRSLKLTFVTAQGENATLYFTLQY